MSQNKQFWSCKDPREISELMYVSPYTLLIFAGLVCYCSERGYPSPILTSIGRTKEEETTAGAQSDSHLTLRAFDISSRPYTLEQIQDICSYMNKEFELYAAVTATGKKVLALYHAVEGGVYHIHFQIHRRFALPAWMGLPV